MHFCEESRPLSAICSFRLDAIHLKLFSDGVTVASKVYAEANKRIVYLNAIAPLVDCEISIVPRVWYNLGFNNEIIFKTTRFKMLPERQT